MSLELKGKLVQVLSPVTGEGKNGQWKKQEFVIETMDQYPKSACFVLWGDKTDVLSTLQQGQQVSVYFDVESREYNGKWYTNLKAWKLEQDTPQDANPESTPVANDVAGMSFEADGDENDLPF